MAGTRLIEAQNDIAFGNFSTTISTTVPLNSSGGTAGIGPHVVAGPFNKWDLCGTVTIAVTNSVASTGSISAYIFPAFQINTTEARFFNDVLTTAKAHAVFAVDAFTVAATATASNSLATIGRHQASQNGAPLAPYMRPHLSIVANDGPIGTASITFDGQFFWRR